MDYNKKLEIIKELNESIKTMEKEKREIKDTIYDEAKEIIEPIINKYFKDNPDYSIRVYAESIGITIYQKRTMPINLLNELQDIFGQGYIWVLESYEETEENDYEIILKK